MDLNISKIIAGVVAAVTDTAKASADKKITVDEALGIVKAAVDAAGLGDETLVDFASKNTGQSTSTG